MRERRVSALSQRKTSQPRSRGDGVTTASIGARCRGVTPPNGDSGDDRQKVGEFVSFVRKRGIRRVLAARRAVIDAHRSQDLSADALEMVLLDEKAKELLQRARGFAGQDVADGDAVSEIIRVAGRHRRTLQVAALGARQWGQHHDYASANRAHRLLQAALTRNAVQPPSADDRRRFEVLDPFRKLAPDEQWRELVRREPRLANVEAEARTGAFGNADDILNMSFLPDEQRRAATIDNLRRLRLRDDRLSGWVGPGCSSPDILLSSRIAREAASGHLSHLP
jgi:hypothetical protein